MPLYVYRCNENGHEFQVRQRMVDDPLTECPVCGGPVQHQELHLFLTKLQ